MALKLARDQIWATLSFCLIKNLYERLKKLEHDFAQFSGVFVFFEKCSRKSKSAKTRQSNLTYFCIFFGEKIGFEIRIENALFKISYFNVPKDGHLLYYSKMIRDLRARV